MDNTELVNARSRSHLLLGETALAPAEVMGKMGCIQGQDYQAALWAIGMRSKPGTTLQDVEKAFSDRKIVRSWILRGTLHIAQAMDVKWMVDLVSPGLMRTAKIRDSHLGLSDEMVDLIESRFVDALSGGRKLTRSQMNRIVEECGVSSGNNLGFHMLYRAAWDGLICFGDYDGTEHTFVSMDEWISESRSPGRDEALVRLAEMYFGSHGPATLKDFSWWAGLKARDAAEAVKGAAGSIIELEHEGKKHFVSRISEMAEPDDDPRVSLLPAFDEYFIGYSDRSAYFRNGTASGKSGMASIKDSGELARIVHSNGIFQPIILINGLVAGKWKRKNMKGRVRVLAEPFRRFSAEEESALRKAASRYGNFLDAALELKLT